MPYLCIFTGEMWSLIYYYCLFKCSYIIIQSDPGMHPEITMHRIKITTCCNYERLCYSYYWRVAEITIVLSILSIYSVAQR